MAFVAQAVELRRQRVQELLGVRHLLPVCVQLAERRARSTHHSLRRRLGQRNVHVVGGGARRHPDTRVRAGGAERCACALRSPEIARETLFEDAGHNVGGQRLHGASAVGKMYDPAFEATFLWKMHDA